MIANRISGLAVALVGLALYFLIIPANTETVDYGWIRPQTLPNICALLLAGAGVVHALFPSGSIEVDWRAVPRALLFVAVAVAGWWAMSFGGFRLAAPALVLATMLLVGERRWYWLLAGTIALPMIIWITVVLLLDRILP